MMLYAIYGLIFYYELLGPKKSAKSKIYILTRDYLLLFAMRHPVRWISVSDQTKMCEMQQWGVPSVEEKLLS